ncbi:double-strand break repair helicase AddA [Roseinatronobacter sp. S2]|uniref:double-strand break repair helicase AddA n=1 Tax=Roseinatronobacter sp. S2 TaxID=3035471 RepID=UPI00240EF9B2|nr:double-strand break repair helicase AddA [Roseinatronobacter sp. S2]WFE74041.1 double-strand break repair helicase AddA [Roseinatronobacter sp. S2]
MSFDDATLSQNRASDPAASTWLSANAGSGKTKVLTDRVARLLLRGVSPQRILCLTYTKAAASEMQNRLFNLLGKWAMLPDHSLSAELHKIGEVAASPDSLAQARRLFARAIEAPGGLKIQTIHSFCASLLRRFPLEAGLSPAFSEMDDRSAHALRADVLDRLADTARHRDVFADLAAAFTGAEIDTLLMEICANAPAFTGDVPESALRDAFELPAGYDTAALCRDVFLGAEGDLMARLLPALDAGTVTDQKAADKLRSLDFGADDVALLPVLESVMLTGSGAKEPFTAKIGSFPTKGTRATLGALVDPLNDLMARVEAARVRRIALACTSRSLALHRFARAFLPSYAQAKAARGWLDFDDLITRTGQLLTDPSVAQWVLFKLDGGVDHILVDEAQDTSPGQWRVIEQLAQEFTAGLGARDGSRTLFVVGDKKQSIYSFQGADLQVFDRMQAQFRDRLAAVDVRLNEALLAHSFRSSDAVLRSVDQTFRPPHDQGLGGVPDHIAFFDRMPGRVDLWPVVEKPDKPKDPEWFQPVDIMAEEHHTRQLARTIAAELRRMIDMRTPIPVRGGARPMTEGDVLILVRRRGPLFHEIISACKAAGLEMAGADRLRLGGEMAVRDLTALLSFLATPEDDLSLAACLRSPLFGWSEDALFRLAHGREGAFLWTCLREHGDAATLAVVDDLRAQTDFLRPFDLVERMLTRHDGRRRLLARLGPEAEDGIDAFLSQALAYEQLETPSLTGFLCWLEHGDVQIKRELDSAGARLRVMTVHGAKGLEAPVVILPDTADAAATERRQIFPVADTVAWRGGAKGETPPLLQSAVDRLADARAQEDARLLYVAMTRAESWLIVAGAGTTKRDTCWHNLVAQGLAHTGAVRCEMPTGQGLRHQHQDWPELAGDSGAHARAPDLASVPDYMWQPVAMQADTPKPLSPSRLGGAKALPGDAGLDEEAAMLRGQQLHLLLEHLPLWDEADWPLRAADLLASSDAGTPADLHALLAEVRGVLSAPALAPIFGPDSLAEVEITATVFNRPLAGIIDRLIVTEHDVQAIDYKSNAVVPPSAADVPEGLLRQMGAYANALQQIFPGRTIRTGLLWTASAQLMWLPADMVAAALDRAALETPRAEA